jgi:hypothetical protein
VRTLGRDPLAPHIGRDFLAPPANCSSRDLAGTAVGLHTDATQFVCHDRPSLLLLEPKPMKAVHHVDGSPLEFLIKDATPCPPAWGSPSRLQNRFNNPFVERPERALQRGQRRRQSLLPDRAKQREERAHRQQSTVRTVQVVTLGEFRLCLS